MQRRLVIPNGPTDDAALDEMRRVWKEVNHFFSGSAKPPIVVDDDGNGFFVSFDAKPASAMLELDEPRGLSFAPGLSGMFIDVKLQSVTGLASAPSPRLWRGVIEQLFLAANFCVPGTLDLTDSWYFLSFRPTDAISRGVDHPPQLASGTMYAAFRVAVELRGWPDFQTLSFQQSWEWLHSKSLYNALISRTPEQRAVFAILRVCTRDRYDPENYFACAAAIEGLVRRERWARGREIRRLIEQELGPMPDADEPDIEEGDENLFQKYHHRRHQIAHGAHPTIRPDLRSEQLTGEAGKLETELQEPVELALGMLMALIRNRIARYSSQLPPYDASQGH